MIEVGGGADLIHDCKIGWNRNYWTGQCNFKGPFWDSVKCYRNQMPSST